MDLSELKLVTASNIINLRTQAGMTQAELGARLNYSDKTISKWERGEAIPDAFVLLSMAEMFGVSVDYILSSHDAWEVPKSDSELETEEQERYSANIVIAIVMLGIFTATLTAFVTVWLISRIEWRIFLVGLSVGLLVLVVLQSALNKGKGLQYIISLLIISLFVNGYFIMADANLWQLFLICVPCIAIANLAFYVKKSPKKLKRYLKKHK